MLEVDKMHGVSVLVVLSQLEILDEPVPQNEEEASKVTNFVKVIDEFLYVRDWRIAFEELHRSRIGTQS